MRETSATVLEPHFAALADLDVREKTPGEVVTAADEEAEAFLAPRLRAIVDVPVVGEEGCAADPALRNALTGERAWLVDPLDGTANFASGSAEWAVMVALID